MKLSPIFCDGMVLQRGADNLIWGKAEPGERIEGRLGGITFSIEAGENGEFEVVLPKLPTGGPYELEVGALKIQDVLIGDVFLLGGQSNMVLPVSRTMELLEKEIKASEDRNIRMFEVPKEYSFEEGEKELSQGKWIKAEGADLQTFSAAGFFMAYALKRHSGIPVGLLQTAVGGTPAKAWCSRQTIQNMGKYTEELKRCSRSGYPQRIEAEELKREEEWRRRAGEAFQEKGIKTGKLTIPGIWKTGELSEFHGAVRLKKTVHLAKAEAQKKAELALGAIKDADKVYVNGTLCGETEYKYPPRFYPIPEGALKEGENTIEIQMCVFRDHGGFMPGKPYGIRFDGKKEVEKNLEGLWDYEIMREMEILPNMTFFNYMASALYQGMLVPIRKYRVCAVLFYQGESNTDAPEGYAEEMKALIRDWRGLMQQEDMPFIYVQLAGFSDGEPEAQGSRWAEFRAEQEKLQEVPETAMVSAIDLGEYNDLHPLDKKTLGERLALAVRNLVYKENMLYSGPVLEEVYPDDNNVLHLVFKNAENGLMVHGGKKQTQEVQELEVEMQAGEYIKVPGRIEGNEVLVKLPGGERPLGVRYAWRDCPMEANLYNKEGLPAVPFQRGWKQE